MEKPALEWRGGVPVSTRFADPYFSLDNGLAESRHVFLSGTGLPGAFRDGYQIAELGFGTGLNLCAAIEAWGRRDGGFSFTSFEAYPMTQADLAHALAAWPDIAETAAALVKGYQTETPFQVGPASVQIIVGDARDTVPTWSGRADAWFLDGFAPARNPELWSAELMRAVAAHTRPGGRCATYTAAGHVRESLKQAGFEVIRQSGYGRKRHMTTGHLTP
ncbi:MAG: tRNA (5-methylaminomethyl-2-thiouridine)(34)-methyltransferase MnmD [Pseudomonadota bacterium]